MSKKEELLRRFLDCSSRLNGHLSKLKSIPSQNFSSLDQKRMLTLQNGIDALKIMAQKLNNFSEEDGEDVAVEKVAVEKAIETAEELEGDQTGKSQAGEPSEVDEIVRKIFEAEDLTGQNDFKPVAGALADAKESNDWTPEVNSIEDMNEAFSNYVANDYFRKVTGREDFAFHLGKKSWSTNPKDYLDKLEKQRPDIAGGLKTVANGAIIGMAIDIALSSIKRNLTYDEYVSQCKEQGIEPIEKSKYTIGTLDDLKKSMLRGGAIGAVSNIALKGGQGAMDGFQTSLAKVNFALTPEDFADASKMAEEQSLDIMKQSFSLSRGYYPGDNNATFLEWLQNNAEEYFSLRVDIYNQILNEAANFSTVKDALIGAGIGGGIGAITNTAITAIKKNKSYDMYKAEAEAKGEKPLSKVAYLAKSKEVQKAALTGLGAGASLGAIVNVGRKSVFAPKTNNGAKNITGGGKKGSMSIENQTGKTLADLVAVQNKYHQMTTEERKSPEGKKLKSILENADKQTSVLKKLLEGKQKYKDKIEDAKTKKSKFNMDLGRRFITTQTEAGNKALKEAKEKIEEIQRMEKLLGQKSDKRGKIKVRQGGVYIETDRDAYLRLLTGKKDGFYRWISKLPDEAKNLLSEFFSVYGYIPQHSSDMLFQNFCCQLVRDGELEFRDLAAINFNFPQYQKDFAINKATVATTAVSSIAGGIGGKILANKKIKQEEKRLGRPLTQEERSKIIRKYVVGGAVATGLTGGAISHGVQHAASQGKVAGGRDKVQSAYGQGIQKVGELKTKGQRLYKKHILGLSDATQDAMDNVKKQNAKIVQQAIGQDPDTWTTDTRMAMNDFYTKSEKDGLARKAMIISGAGMAYKTLAPMIQQAVSRGAKVDESKVQAIVQKMQAEGKSEEEIRSAVSQYLQAAFFSYAQGFHKYY